jgi:hypothetical protein
MWIGVASVEHAGVVEALAGREGEGVTLFMGIAPFVPSTTESKADDRAVVPSRTIES